MTAGLTRQSSVRRRRAKGEVLEAILADYPKLTDEERGLVRAACQ